MLLDPKKYKEHQTLLKVMYKLVQVCVTTQRKLFKEEND